MKNNLKKLLCSLLALTVVLSMAGLAMASEEEDASEEEQAEQAEIVPLTEEELAALPRIGEETEDCSQIVLVNATEGDITAINIKASDEDQWSDNILAEDDVYEAEETALLCWEAEEDVLYDLQLTFSDWTVGVAHDVDFADITQANLQRQWNGLPYLVYVSVATGEEVDTSEAEQARAEAEIAAGTWAYGGDSSSSGSSGGSSSSSGSSGGSSSGGGSSSEGCLDDALFW